MPGNLGLTLCPGIKITIVLNHPNPNPYSKDHCDVQVIDDVVVAETVNSNGPANVRLKSCKVVLEEIIPKCGAEKLKTLNPPPEKTHKSDSRPTEGMFLQDLQARTPIAWGKMSDDRWAVLDSAVFGKLHPCQSLSKKVKLLEDSIYEEGAKIFGHSPSHHKNLSVTSRRTAHSISLINEKNTLLRQIASMSNLVQKAALEQLLSQVKSKIKLLRRAENGRKKRWKFKKAQAAFRSNPYRAGKSLLDPKCSTTLQVEQSVLDSHKSSSVSDKFFDIPLCALEGLPESPSISKPFSLVALKYEDFVSILNTRRNASAPGYNVIPYKVYKKCTKNKFLLV